MITRDDIELAIPNRLIANKKLVNGNCGLGHSVRSRITLQRGYEASLNQVEQTLLEIAYENADLWPHRYPMIRF